MNRTSLCQLTMNLRVVYVEHFVEEQQIFLRFHGAVIAPKTIEEQLILKCVVIAHYNGGEGHRTKIRIYTLCRRILSFQFSEIDYHDGRSSTFVKSAWCGRRSNGRHIVCCEPSNPPSRCPGNRICRFEVCTFCPEWAPLHSYKILKKYIITDID